MSLQGVTGSRATVSVVASLHALGLALLALGVASGGAGLVASAVVAYALGLRHAVDADHIAMIDNSTRKFVAEGRRSAAVGLAFSAGHSTVVLVAAALVIAGTGWIGSTIDEDSVTRHWLGVVGAGVAATYLAAIAVTNLPVLARAWADLGRAGPAGPGVHGGVSRVLLAPLARVRQPWHVYGFGLLFGLGFDTASSVAVLVLAVGLPAGTAPLVLLSLPLLFAAAMTLGDSLNGFLMLKMYSSAQHRKRARYNVVITAVSIAAAVAISLITFAGLASDLGVRLPAIDALAGVDTDWAGIGLLVFFALIGVGAAAAVRWRSLGHPVDI
ncbi:HoxN/HupN/NixA family nickel/cobalt transporter [Tessaracoccus sp. MC1679]|uniref:HoxN/HupN/NixA family nickel/cobalt transporter n=1 Tax=Tessaracoccus sp. MC1679 TaxID=2760313 RepID=UPI0015FF24E2|nr:nickel transporter [Tessaracoccus sp. MC1679]MBB1517023.1 nickel transporter [Tessaracoccus sp. MC1679]